MAQRPRRRSRSLVLIPALLGLVSLSCIEKKPPVRSDRTMTVAVAFVYDEDEGYAARRVPDIVQAKVVDALEARNLRPRRLPFEQFSREFAKRRTTSHRLAHLASLERDTDLLLLVETRAVYYSHLNGRYRWTVDARVTLSGKDLGAASTRELSYAAFLDFDHERGPEALESVAPRIAEVVGKLTDDYLGGLNSRAALDAVGGVRLASVASDLGPFLAAPAQPTPVAVDSDAIYFILVDRFANGDPKNDGAVDKSDPQAFHGGDLKGVIAHLDELQKLGVRTVWLSPVFKTQQHDFHGYGAYHGYWTMDLGEIEPRFGTAEDLATLSRELHARGMRLVLDIVLNHVGYESPLREQHPDWFHHNGTITDWNDSAQLLTFDVHGLPDLDQTNPEVYAYLLQDSEKWIREVHPDGFRLDAVKHVSMDFWARYNRDIRAKAGAGFLLLGEDLDGDPRALAASMRRGGFSSMFDFPLHFAMVDTFCKGAHTSRLASVLTADRFYENPGALVTLLDNHDLPRILSACGGDVNKVKSALTFMMTARGTPSLLYGTEVGLTGEKEPANRGDMHFDARNPLVAHVRDALALRREHPVLRSGANWILTVEPDLFVYARVQFDGVAVVAVNTGTKKRRIELPEEFTRDAMRFDARDHKRRGAWKVGPGEVEVAFIEPVNRTFGALVQRLEAQHPRSVTFHLRGYTGEAAPRVTGSDPALGYWDPATSPEMSHNTDGTWSATLRLPAGVYEYKFVAPGDSPVWEDIPNRCLFLPATSAPAAATPQSATWNQPRAVCDAA